MARAEGRPARPALLYRCTHPKTGEWTDEFAVELLFENEQEAKRWLGSRKMPYQHVPDTAELIHEPRDGTQPVPVTPRRRRK